ncbi:MAG: type II toxin-antitoxin system RelE/ParE family toxin [Alphaproteobacteria bacterium]|nr:type II toxin-antitoxin system RelE/ParE family toxin [Alphaproteobacteria bacterium]
MENYQILYESEVVQSDIPALSKDVVKLIRSAIEKKLAVNPIEFGKPLQYDLLGHRRLRVGDYRVIYRIEKKLVIISAIKCRREIYNE